ncbi:DUF2853 family protein [Parvularcula sp. LCG005]|uniref:DUF2853 family protein n=1 Tax=Parvularcula sp. LCG005 TaxID=3078805 RepID=UPI002942CC54|nr:DUF2853 family protein [Parvularcula sp. LCG005]WOI53356.1 DUF2853 family protein [Parvularcula sp. LCG005]
MAEDKHAEYLAKVQKYDADANADTVRKIANKLGIALQNRDSSLVSCSDTSELERIRDGFAKKTLGLDAGHSDDQIMAAINEVCVMMAGDGSNKHRVPFYYLLAKSTNTLGKIG